MPEVTSSLLQRSVPSMASHTCRPRGREHLRAARPPKPAHGQPSAYPRPPRRGPAHLQAAAAPPHHDQAALQLQAPDGAVCAGGPGQARGALLGRAAPLVLGGQGGRPGPRGGRAQGRRAAGRQAIVLVHALHQAAEVVARAVASTAAARPVPGLGLRGFREPRLGREVSVDQAGEVWLVPEEGRRRRAPGPVPQRRAVPRLLRAPLPAVGQPFPALLSLERAANATVAALPARGQEDGVRTQDGREGEGGEGAGTYPRRGMRVRQSPVCASHTHTWPARQQLTSSMPSLARHSMSCARGAVSRGSGPAPAPPPAPPPPPHAP